MSSEGTRACLTIPEYPISFSLSYSSLQAPTTCTHESMSIDWLIGSRVSDPMTQSLVILPSNRGRRKTDLTPTIPWERENYLRSASPGNIAGVRSQAKRAVSMSRLDILAQPRRRPSANMDQAAQHPPSTTGVNSKGLQKDMHCPSRPRSSQSMASEQSVASTVSMRSHSGPRRARPFSIAGSIIPANPEAGQVHLPLPPQRRSRTAERKVPVVPPARPPRARSIGPDAAAATPSSTPKTASRKPPVAPKSVSASPKVEKEESQETSKEVPPKVDQEDQLLNGASEETIKIESNEPVVQPEPVIKTPAPQPTAPEPAKPEEAKEGTVPSVKAPRITSEEEAKAALAEKRRLAREQAEREAELERQRQEALRLEEEERIRKEEEEQRRMEEEQLRLAEELRKQEEEKLQKAIEEQAKREEEEEARKEQENLLRLEREEQERKLKEEAERQRQEQEEKRKQEEAARAERKKRVEQIMKRTRAKNEAAQKADESEKAAESSETTAAGSDSLPAEQNSDSKEGEEEEKCDNLTEPVNEAKVLPVTESVPPKESGEIRVNGMKNNEDSDVGVTKLTESITVQDELKEDFANMPVVLGKAATGVESMAVSADTSPQSNGYGSHDLNFSEISPDEGTQQGQLLDFTSEGGTSDSQWNPRPPSPPTEFEQLIDLSSLTMSNQNEVNRLNNADELNSNRAPGIPFIAFEDNVTKKQESSITDLLS